MHHGHHPAACTQCAGDVQLGFDFTMAFQPIVNAKTQDIFAFEALARGSNNEPAGWVFAQVNEQNRYRFDQQCRIKAIEQAARLRMPALLSINFMPNAVYNPERCIRTTLEAADASGFPIDQIIFEITESEKVSDLVHLREIVSYYKQRGFRTAIDDFGAGYSGLNLLADIQTDFVKLDMALIRNIHQDRIRQIIVRGILQVCQELPVTTIAEGIETVEEFRMLQDFGVNLFQGYYFARPAFQALPEVPSHVFTCTERDPAGQP